MSEMLTMSVSTLLSLNTFTNILNYIPYNFISGLVSQPDALYGSGKALIVNVNAIPTHKFVWVYNASTSLWDFTVSTSMVKTLTQATYNLGINGTPIAETELIRNEYQGSYRDCFDHAVTCFNNGYTLNSCVDIINVGYKNMPQMNSTMEMFKPDFIGQMP